MRLLGPALRRATPRRFYLRLTPRRAPPRSRAEAGKQLTLSELPLNAHGRRVLVADGASLAFYLLGPRRRGTDRAPLVSAWHLGGEYRDLAARTRCVFSRAPRAVFEPGGSPPGPAAGASWRASARLA